MRVCAWIQDYEQKLARLQADYSAEQESKAKLQEDIAALRMSYETKLSSLERAKATRERKLTPRCIEQKQFLNT